MRLEIKIRSQRYDINWPRPRHGHKSTIYNICLSKMMVIYIKQHLSSIYEKDNQHWSWVEKKSCL